ncbi:hypothetical protein OESDEN_15301 [Oesophagostomum dentatum]|uniref:Uncharacterized protein n=1 Tax=Oesophagostomum dentatum TaxID=61180 RepID=A0A0B1SJ84_OESDE|nr:hypothetical protein OESDEN_15301 [Oesophagostomum dentatum]
MARQIPRDGFNKNTLIIYDLAEKTTSKTPKEIVSGLGRPSNPTSKQGPLDKYDKYAAFVATTLRDMPEPEAKRRMKEMTMLLIAALAEKTASKTPKEIVSGLGRSSNPTSKQGPLDKYDKYAAFVATTLRDMPEPEAKKRMKEMTMLLLEEY